MKIKVLGLLGIALVVVFFLSLLEVSKLVEKKFDPMKSWTKDRILQSLRVFQVEEIKRSKNLVLFLGSSEAEVGFSPSIFDAYNENRRLPTQALNLSARNVGTLYPLYLKRITRELKENKIRPKLIFLHLPISRFTRRSLSKGNEFKKSSGFSTLYYDFSMLEDSDIPMDDQINLFFSKLITGGMHLPTTFTVLRKNLRKSILGSFDDKTKDELNLWNDPRLLVQPAWSVERGGQHYFYWPGESLRKRIFDQYLNIMPLRSQVIKRLRKHEKCCDFIKLRIDENYLEKVIASINQLREQADKVVVVVFPENPLFERPFKYRRRPYDIVNEISLRSEIEVIDPSTKVNFKEEHYIDLLHFTPEGFRLFTEAIAEMTSSDWLKTESK